MASHWSRRPADQANLGKTGFAGRAQFSWTLHPQTAAILGLVATRLMSIAKLLVSPIPGGMAFG